MTGEQFDRVAAKYRRSYGEPLVADAEWVGPIYEMCRGAVECDPSGPDSDETHTDFTDEVVSRAAAVIAVMTHGPGIVRSPKQLEYERLTRAGVPEREAFRQVFHPAVRS